jgi:parvulin-like peptidyl-prolyl isomerase
MLEKASESEVNRFIARHDGNYAKAQKALEAMGFDWESYREYQKKLILTQTYLQKEMTDERVVTYDELLEHYNMVKSERFETEGVVEFSLIDIHISEFGSGVSETAKEAALQRAESLVKRIRDGEEFEALAKEFSHGHRAAMGGKWNPVTVGSLASPFDVIEISTQEMEAGEVSDPIEAGGHVFIVKLESKRSAEHTSFEEVQEEIESEVIYMHRREQFEKKMTKLIVQSEVGNLEEFMRFCLEAAFLRCVEQY